MARTTRLIAIVAVFTLAVAGGAAAIESEEPTDGAADEGLEELVDSWFWYDAEVMQLTYGLPDAAGETPDCGPMDETDPGTSEESTALEEDPAVEVPEGCRVVDVVGPSGKVTHGSVVSAFVHSLKEDYDKELYGPKGQWIREVAWSSHGKWWADSDGEGSVESTDAGPGKSKKPKKAKKPKHRDR